MKRFILIIAICTGVLWGGATGLFIAAYFSQREYGLLVPGGVLTGLGLGLLAED